MLAISAGLMLMLLHPLLWLFPDLVVPNLND